MEEHVLSKNTSLNVQPYYVNVSPWVSQTQSFMLKGHGTTALFSSLSFETFLNCHSS